MYKSGRNASPVPALAFEAMRIIATVLGNLSARALVLCAAALLLTECRQVSDKDIGLIDSEINQIVQLRRAAKVDPAPLPAAPERNDAGRETTAVGDRAAEASGDAIRKIDRKAVLAATEKRPRKRPKNLAVPDKSRLTPWGFGPLPVFTTFTLLGLRP
jgi:hypothetical protein